MVTLFSTDSLYPSHLPRTPDGGYDTSRLWRGCHNSAIPLPKLAHIEGLPPSPWESVSKFHFTRCGVYAQVACPGSTARWRSIGSAGLSASQRPGVVLSTSTSVCVLVSSCVQFSRYREGLVKKSLHLVGSENAVLSRFLKIFFSFCRNAQKVKHYSRSGLPTTQLQ